MPSLTAALLIATLCASADGMAFANVKPGDVVENAQLRALGGGKKPFLGKEKAGVFLFFSMNQEYSRQTLETFAKLQKELEGKPVFWTAVVSDRFPAAEIEAAVKAAGLTSPVLLDEGDALYGRLGGSLTPIVGIVDVNHKLVSYLPFQKVNYGNVIKAWVQKALGEITDEQLQAVLSPAPVSDGGDGGSGLVARRHLKMGQRLLKVEDFAGAATSAKKSLGIDPNLADAHALLGNALAAQGNCAEALPSFARALELDPQNAAAAEGKAKCAPGAAAPPTAAPPAPSAPK